MRVPRRALYVLTPLASVFAGMAAAQTLVPHRAVYDLALSHAEEDSQVEALDGRWVFEFSGSACEGYTLKSRIVMRFDTTEGPRLVDQRVTSFEDAAGETLRFVTRSYIDQELDNEVKGTARLEDGNTVVDYEAPEETRRSFGPTLFPTAQMRELLERLQAGEHFYETAIFDGTEFAKQAVMVSVVMGKARPVPADDIERPALGRLAEESFVPVTAAYFDGDAADGEETSDYNVSFKLHESGIQRDMVIRYADYAMTAKLADLPLHEPDEACEQEDRE